MNFGFYLLRREHEIEISSPFWLINLSTFSKNVGMHPSRMNQPKHTICIYLFPYYGKYMKTYSCCLFNHI